MCWRRSGFLIISADWRLITSPPSKTAGKCAIGKGGQFDVGINKLGWRSNVMHKKFAPKQVQETFWHEVTHAILHDMGRDTLNRDEKFFTEFAHRVTKGINTASF